MSEWWTYRLDDLLMFAPATYWRLFERVNAAWWPLPPLAWAAGAGLLVLARQGRTRWAFVGLAIAWAFVAGAYHAQRYAQINTGAPWFAGAFTAQALLLSLRARPERDLIWRPAPAWLGAAALAWPLLDLALGRQWAGVQVFGIAPDPTVLATLALLAMQRAPAWWLWPLPLAWCLASGATLWTMGAPEAPLLPLAGAAALGFTLRSRSGSS